MIQGLYHAREHGNAEFAILSDANTFFIDEILKVGSGWSVAVWSVTTTMTTMMMMMVMMMLVVQGRRSVAYRALLETYAPFESFEFDRRLMIHDRDI